MSKTPKLAVRQKEAAAMLSISRRWLQELTERGDIPCIRRGRSVLYRVAALEQWLAKNEQTHSQEATS